MQRPPDKVLKLADAMLFVVGDQRRGARGRREFGLEPTGIAQQRVEFFALAGFGEMVRQKEVEIPPRKRIGVGRSAKIIERPQQLFVQRDQPRFARLVLKEAADHVVGEGRSLARLTQGHPAGGAPGVRSARFAGEHASDGDNLARLIAEVPAGSALRYVCVIALADPLGGERLFEGTCTGRMAPAAAGAGGFGYDPVFIPDDGPGELTMAELSDEGKDAISHRGRAARALLAALAD